MILLLSTIMGLAINLIFVYVVLLVIVGYQVEFLSCFSVNCLLLFSLGLRNAGSHLSAAFSSDGKHIVSASEDSNVYLWNFHIPAESSVSQPEEVRSFEFFSSDASIAIPWSGLKNVNHENQCHSQGPSQSLNNFPFRASPCFSLGQGLFLEAIPKGSATWPEEKLPLSSPTSVPSAMCKSQYKFLKSSCQSSSSYHSWGLVIVTAGYDGRIRSYHNYGLPSPV